MGGGVAVSIGVTTLPGGQLTKLDELTRDADTALYAAKAAGRNRVTAFEADVAA